MDKNYKQYLPKINFTLEVLLEGLRSTNLRIDNISGGEGGSQDLQSVLEAGSFSQVFDSIGDSYYSFNLDATSGNLYNTIDQYFDDGLGLSGRSAILQHNGKFSLYESTNSGTITLEFEEPTSGGTPIIKIPAKPSGDHTLATLDDIYKIPSVPIFADNATAIIGGLVVDNIYKTVTGELRIVV